MKSQIQNEPIVFSNVGKRVCGYLLSQPVVFLMTFFSVSLLPWVARGQTAPPEVSFIRDVRPILSDKCFQCHGPDAETREADLRFDQEESALQVIDRNAPRKSEILERILHLDADALMPPPENINR